MKVEKLKKDQLILIEWSFYPETFDKNDLGNIIIYYCQDEPKDFETLQYTLFLTLTVFQNEKDNNLELHEDVNQVMVIKCLLF